MKTSIINAAGAFAIVSAPFILWYGSDLLNLILDAISGI